MPKCLGGTENWVHISQVAGVVEGSNPPIGQMAAAGAATEVDLKVACLLYTSIRDEEAVFQLCAAGGHIGYLKSFGHRVAIPQQPPQDAGDLCDHRQTLTVRVHCLSLTGKRKYFCPGQGKNICGNR